MAADDFVSNQFCHDYFYMSCNLKQPFSSAPCRCCGSSLPFLELLSSGPTVLVNFHSDAGVESKGFSFDWNQVQFIRLELY